MRRYDTKLEDGTVYVEWDDDWLEIGAMDALTDLFGGDTYEIEYDDRQAKTPWLESSLDGRTLTFDVTETILGMDFDEEFVSDLVEVPIDETGSHGYPARTEAFAEKMIDIWEAQGSQEDED